MQIDDISQQGMATEFRFFFRYYEFILINSLEKNFIDWLSNYSNFIIHNSNKWEYIDENWNLYIFGIICMEIVFSIMHTDARGSGTGPKCEYLYYWFV